MSHFKKTQPFQPRVIVFLDMMKQERFTLQLWSTVLRPSAWAPEAWRHHPQGLPFPNHPYCWARVLVAQLTLSCVRMDETHCKGFINKEQHEEKKGVHGACWEKHGEIDRGTDESVFFSL